MITPYLIVSVYLIGIVFAARACYRRWRKDGSHELTMSVTKGYVNQTVPVDNVVVIILSYAMAMLWPGYLVIAGIAKLGTFALTVRQPPTDLEKANLWAQKHNREKEVERELAKATAEMDKATGLHQSIELPQPIQPFTVSHNECRLWLKGY